MSYEKRNIIYELLFVLGTTYAPKLCNSRDVRTPGGVPKMKLVPAITEFRILITRRILLIFMYPKQLTLRIVEGVGLYLKSRLFKRSVGMKTIFWFYPSANEKCFFFFTGNRKLQSKNDGKTGYGKVDRETIVYMIVLVVSSIGTKKNKE